MTTSSNHPGIVVGVDGSAASRAAITWAARDAAMRNISLTLVHVAAGVGGTWPATPPPVGFGEWQQRHGRELIVDAMSIVADAAPETDTGQVKTETYYSAVIPTLVDMSKGAEMMVVGRRGVGA